MRYSRCAAALALLASALAAVPVSAQTGPLVLHLPGSTRALGLGGAYVTTGPDADAVFYNPVLLLTGRGLSMSVQRYGHAATLTSFSGALDANVGFGVQLLNYEAPHEYLVGSPSALTRENRVAASSYAAAVGYARVVRKVRIGTAAKYGVHFAAGQTTESFAFDVGSSINPVGWLTAALSVQNIGEGSTIACTIDTCFQYQLPTRIALHASMRPRPVGEFDGLGAAYLAHTNDEGVTGGGGIELSYWPFQGLTFFARGGARFGLDHGTFTAGGGVSYNRVTLDYAWEPFERAADAHRIGFRIR